MADKKEIKRARNWCAVVYPDSAPSDWMDKLDSLNLKWACSPLHEFDLDDDGSPKKSHWHIIICYSGNKSFDQVKEDISFLCCPIPQICRDVRSSVRYFLHLDHPHKHQYSQKDIKTFGGFDVADCLKLSQTEKKEVVSEILKFVRENNITEYFDLVNYCLDEHFDDWFPVVTEGYTLLITNYIKSFRHKKLDSIYSTVSNDSAK